MTLTSPSKKRSGAGDGTSARATADGTAGSARAPRAGGAVPGRLRSWTGAARKATVDWLDRPMTSLHLILAIFALMLGIGLLMVLSSSAVTSYRNLGSSFSVFTNQAIYAAVGLIGFFGAQYIPVKILKSFSLLAVIVSIALLVAVLVPGIGALVNGARSWIRIGGFQFQPSEIAKLALLLWMAQVLAARRSTLGSPKALLIPVLPVFGLMAALIMMQPDLGTTVSLAIVFFAVLFFAGAPWWMFASLAGAGLAGVFYLAVSANYRLARMLSFINPESHPDSSYQLLQSLYGMGNGGWFGVGLGQSRAKWNYLPNADSDFIFAIIGEELGFIGAALVIFLFALLAYTGLRIARRNSDPFIKIVASAATVWLVGQACINIGYVVGLLPVTGIPLPMISAGGTSLLITMAVFGLLANFARHEREAEIALAAAGGSRIARFLGLKPAGPGGRTVLRRRR
ncbi:putative lipid II flippase FtsW, partial [Nakamurella sp.]|uniref:putative lipid II flippase FtsW n=1 Tax=Nakamurella sp. TaxID=1869182 RepID=UPI003B3A3B10